MTTRMQSMCSFARCVAALAGTLIVAAHSPAGAAMDVFVDGAGVCAGKTPCFNTIQAGVNNAGPAPATVSVFPGTYNESVDLGLMGSAIGGSAGDLTLDTLDSAGMPAHGGVNVFPPAGPALGDSLATFPGRILIDGFTVKSPNVTGISLNTVTGLVTLGFVVSDGNKGEGFALASGGNGVSLFRSSFSGNLGGNGMSLVTPDGITMEGVTADNNSGEGASFSVTAGAVGVLQSSFSGNKGGSGLSFATAAGVGFDQVTADNNKGSGATFAVAGPVQVSRSSFSGNTNGDGITFATATDVTFDQVTADNNQNTGATFALTGTVKVTWSSFSGATNGGGLSFATATDVTLTDVTADNNQNTNATFAMTGELQISSSSFSGAKNGSGLSFATPTRVALAGVVADGNQDSGAQFAVNGPVDISGSSFSNNKNGDGIEFATATRVDLVHVTASGNSQDGLSAALQSAQITGSSFEHNGRNGLLLGPTEGGDDFRLSCNDIDGNLTGLRLIADAVVDAAHNYWGSPTGPTYPTNPTGTGDPIVDGANGGAGTVKFEPFLIAPAAASEFCSTRGAPALGAPALVLLLLGLLIVPGWQLARSAGQDSTE